jgi:hypothetical protein
MTSQPAPLAASRTRQGGGFVGLAWLTWRQHRWMIVAGVLGFGLFTAYLLWIDHEIAGVAASCASPCSAQSQRFDFYKYMSDARLGLATATFAGLLVAVFAAAPLVSREYEQRTYLVAWSQDVSASRWLAVKFALLAAVATVLLAVLGGAASVLAHRIHNVNSSYSLFDDVPFAATPLMQASYALFGFSLGLAISALIRRTVPAMGLTLVVFIATRLLVARERPYFMPPLRHVTAVGGYQYLDLGENALYVGGGYADAAGVPMADPCSPSAVVLHSTEQWRTCLRDHGVVSQYSDYQPGSRMGTFHLIEEGIFVGLAAVLFVLAWWRVRRATTIG